MWKKLKKKNGIVIEDEFDSVKFVGIQADRLKNHLSRVEFSDTQQFYVRSLNERGLEIEEAFCRIGIHNFCVIGDNFYP